MNNFAHLKPDSPFNPVFADCGGWVPIINILVPSPVQLEGSHETEAYLVDIKKLSEERFMEICRIMSRRISTLNEQNEQDMIEGIKEDIIRRGGLPLRVSQTDSVSTDCMFWL